MLLDYNMTDLLLLSTSELNGSPTIYVILKQKTKCPEIENRCGSQFTYTCFSDMLELSHKLRVNH